MPAATVSHEQFYISLEEILSLPARSLSGTEEVQGLKGWDSLAILEVMTMASMEYDSEVEPTDLANCKTVDDLAAAVIAARTSAT